MKIFLVLVLFLLSFPVYSQPEKEDSLLARMEKKCETNPLPGPFEKDTKDWPTEEAEKYRLRLRTDNCVYKREVYEALAREPRSFCSSPASEMETADCILEFTHKHATTSLAAVGGAAAIVKAKPSDKEAKQGKIEQQFLNFERTFNFWEKLDTGRLYLANISGQDPYMLKVRREDSGLLKNRFKKLVDVVTPIMGRLEKKMLDETIPATERSAHAERLRKIKATIEKLSARNWEYPSNESKVSAAFSAAPSATLSATSSPVKLRTYNDLAEDKKQIVEKSYSSLMVAHDEKDFVRVRERAAEILAHVDEYKDTRSYDLIAQKNIPAATSANSASSVAGNAEGKAPQTLNVTEKWKALHVKRAMSHKAQRESIIKKEPIECATAPSASACLRAWLQKNPPMVTLDVTLNLVTAIAAASQDQTSGVLAKEAYPLAATENSLAVFDSVDTKKFEIHSLDASGLEKAIQIDFQKQEQEQLRTAKQKLLSALRKLMAKYEKESFATASESDRANFQGLNRRLDALEQREFSL